MKKSLILVGMLAIGYANAQYDGKVGVNTETPSATFNVKSKTGNDATTKNLELENADGVKMVTVLDNGYVGIGTDSPISKLHIETDGVKDNSIVHKGYGPWSNKSWAENIYGFYRARGNSLALEAVKKGDEVGHISYYLYNGTKY